MGLGPQPHIVFQRGMHSMTARFLRLTALLAVLAAALVIAACGSDNSSSESTSGATSTAATSAVARDAALAALLPKAIADKGSITVATDASYPPNEFFQGKTIVGMDPDLAQAIGQVLGVKVDVQNATFDGIIPGIASGKYDLGMSSFTDTKEREATVDFATYFSAGTSFYTLADGGTEVSGLADLCGKTVAVEKGTTQQTDAEAQSKKCTGGEKVTVLTFPDQNGANLAISSGRAQIGMADSPVAAYQVKQSGGKFKLTGTPYGEAPYGIAMAKDQQLAKAIQGAVQKLIDGGQYQTILDKWGIGDGAIKTSEINGAVS